MHRHAVTLMGLGLALSITACTHRTSTVPEILACRVIPYVTAELEECACTPEIEPDGVMTVLAAAPASFDGGRTVEVRFEGDVVERGTTGADGSLAMVVAIPGRECLRVVEGMTLTVVVAGTSTEVFVRGSHESYLELDEDGLREQDFDGRIAGSARFRPLAPGGVARTDTSPITRVFAANADVHTARVQTPTPMLHETFTTSITGLEGDLVFLGAIHENGAMSGCWWPDNELLEYRCGGSEWGGLGVRRAGCSQRRRDRGECRTEPEGTLDGGVDASVDAHYPDAPPS